jgi:cysteine desulfurase
MKASEVKRMEEIYMDYNATTPLREEALETLRRVFEDGFGNASSVHSAGRRAKAYLDEAREKVAAALGAKASEMVFTGGGSESDNLAIKGTAWRFERGHIVTSRIEHPAVLNTCRFLERRGFEVTYLGVSADGLVDPDMVKDAIRDDTILVSIMWANNETGVVQPIERIAEIVKEKGKLFHTDAVQALGKVEVDVGAVPVDLLSISGHKLYAPKGVGALFVRRGVGLEAVVHGGGQERGMRSGTQNVPSIAAMGTACESSARELPEESARLSSLREKLEAGLKRGIEGVRINCERSPRLPNTSNVTFHGAEGEAILIGLDERGISVSSASACAAGRSDPSHVLTAMGLSVEEASNTIRFSLGRYSREEHVTKLLEVLPPVVERLRAL